LTPQNFQQKVRSTKGFVLGYWQEVSSSPADPPSCFGFDLPGSSTRRCCDQTNEVGPFHDLRVIDEHRKVRRWARNAPSCR
jgi:hypothetical protein